jgi:hypothetical protein
MKSRIRIRTYGSVRGRGQLVPPTRRRVKIQSRVLKGRHKDVGKSMSVAMEGKTMGIW